ncbi:protein starmaker-like [Branchiostoma lanceolatum]|uniref:protein starmaker-like n=1 Tax=Branchiostoma lanceolatum TaxID=7740 RepID=UPI003452EA29
MQLLLVSLAVLQIYSWPRGGANAGPVEKEACPGGNCDSSYSFNNDDVLIRKQRYAMSGRGGPDGGQTDSDREDDSDGVQIETLEWDEGDHDGPHFHGQSDIYKSVLLQTDPEDGQPVQMPPLAGDDEPADEKPAKDLDKFKARSAPTTEDKAALEDSTTDEDRDNDDKEKTLMFEDSEDKESSQNKDVEPKKKKKKTGKRDHDDFSGLHFHRMSSLYKTVMTKGELEEEEEEVNGSEVKDQSNGKGQDDDLDVEDSKNGDEKDKDEENGPEDAEGPTDTTADENKDSVDKNKDDENGPEETEGPSETTADEDRDSVDEKLIDSLEDKESSQSKDVEPKKKRRKRDTEKRDHDDFSGLHFHRMSSLYKTVMTKGELEEEEEVKGSEVKGQSKDEGPDDEVDKDSDEHECTDENCPGCSSCQNEKPETSEDEAEEAPEDEDSGEDEGGEKSSEEDEGRATNSEDDEVVKETDQRTSAEEQLNGEENQNKEDEHKTEPVEDDMPINVKDYISRMLVKYRDERLVHSHTDDP